MQLSNPFLGLKPFGFDDAHLFFGREKHIEAVKTNLAHFHFVSVIGNSGSGKSSFIRAGLLPALFDDNWEVFTLRPGNNPIGQLVEAISKGKDADKNADVLRRNKRGIYQIFREAGYTGKNLILVDQFEELFRFKATNQNIAHEAHLFVDLLLNAIKDVDSPVYVALTLRSEFVGMCEQFVGLPELMNKGQFLIPRMNANEIRSSITGPIKQSGAKITHRLLHRLEQETQNKPDLLPVMQHALMRTFSFWKDNNTGESIDIEHYEATGGIKNALSNHANEVYEWLNDDQKKLCASVFKVLGYRNDEGLSIRRPTRLGLIAKICNATTDDVISTIKPFRDKDVAFLVPDSKKAISENSIIDIAHESLIRNWDNYAAWIREESFAVDIYSRLTESALLYKESKAGLYRQPELKQALEWRENNKPNEFWAAQYNKDFVLTIDFLTLSKQDYDFERRNKLRTRKFLIAALVAVILILSVLSIWAITQRNTAEENAALLKLEKIEAEKQKSLAEEARIEAEMNLEKAVSEEKRANEQLEITEIERNRANNNAERAKLKTNEALKAQFNADQALALAIEREKETRIQKGISDSLFVKADSAQKAATKLQMLAIAKNLSISSQIIQPTNEANKREKVLTALYALRINDLYNNGNYEPELFKSLNLAYSAVIDEKSRSVSGHSDEVKSVALMPQNNAVVSAAVNGKVLVNELNTGKELTAFQVPTSELISKVLVEENGQRLVIIGGESVFIYNISDTKEPEDVLNNLHEARIIDAVMLGQKLITVNADGGLKSFDISNVNTKIESFSLSRNVKAICRYKEDCILVATNQREVVVWDVKNKSEVKTLAEVKSDITCVDYDFQSGKIVIGCSNGSFYLLNDNQLQEFTGHTAAITSIALSPNAGLLATGSFDSKVLFWNLASNSNTPIEFGMHRSFVHSVDLNSKVLVTGGKDRKVFVTNLDQHKIYNNLKLRYPDGFTQREWQNIVGEETKFLEL